MSRRAFTATAGIFLLASVPLQTAEVVARQNLLTAFSQDPVAAIGDRLLNMPIKVPNPSINYSLRVLPPPRDRHYTLTITR